MSTMASTRTIIFLFTTFLMSGLYSLVLSSEINSTIIVIMDQEVFRVSEQYLSICLDAHILTDPNWTIDSFPARAVNMAKALSPAMLRVGGTQGDQLVFNKMEKAEHQLSPSQWDALNEFTKKVGWDFIFGLNILLNKPNSSLWDPANAKELFEYTKSKGYKVNWELGNEPTTLSFKTLAKDFDVLSTIVNEKTWIVGPDMTDGDESKFFKFLSKIVQEGNFLHAVTWHSYYFGNTGTEEMYTNLTIMNSFLFKAGHIVFLAKLAGFKGEIWLGETADAYDGGVNGISDSYLAGFLWLDKLGVAAFMRHSRVFRQTFYGGHYSLLTPDFQPTPNYWISVIYKRLVGPQVLAVSNRLLNVRVYAHCGLQDPGSVVLFMINLDHSEVVFSLEDPQLKMSSRDIYWLTSTELPELTSKGVALGGKPLVLNGDDLPELNPVHQQPSNTITISPLSYGFIVFKEAHAPVCSN